MNGVCVDGSDPSREAASLEAAWLSLCWRGGSSHKAAFPSSPVTAGMLGPMEGDKVLVCFGRVGICPHTSVHPHTVTSLHTPHPCSSHVMWCFNKPENGSINIKNQINTQYWRRFPHQCSSYLTKLLLWSILSIKGTSSKLMKHKNDFVRDTY